MRKFEILFFLTVVALLIFGGPGDKKKVDTAGKEPASDEHVVATVDKHHAHDHAKSSKPSRSPKVPATAVKPNTVNEPEHSKELTPPNLAGLEVKESEDVKDESAAATAPSDAAEVSEQVVALPSGRGEPHDSHENLGHDELTTEKAAKFADSGTRPPINWPPQPQPYVYPETDPSTFKYPAFGDAPRIGRGMDQPRSADGSQRNGRQQQNTATLRGTIDPLPYGVQR